jgi:hypothetical protein
MGHCPAAYGPLWRTQLYNRMAASRNPSVPPAASAPASMNQPGGGPDAGAGPGPRPPLPRYPQPSPGEAPVSPEPQAGRRKPPNPPSNRPPGSAAGRTREVSRRAPAPGRVQTCRARGTNGLGPVRLPAGSQVQGGAQIELRAGRLGARIGSKGRSGPRSRSHPRSIPPGRGARRPPATGRVHMRGHRAGGIGSGHVIGRAVKAFAHLLHVGTSTSTITPSSTVRAHSGSRSIPRGHRWQVVTGVDHEMAQLCGQRRSRDGPGRDDGVQALGDGAGVNSGLTFGQVSAVTEFPLR